MYRMQPSYASCENMNEHEGMGKGQTVQAHGSFSVQQRHLTTSDCGSLFMLE